MQKACGLDAQFGIGNCSGFLKQPWTGVRVSLCLLTEDLATYSVGGWKGSRGNCLLSATNNGDYRQQPSLFYNFVSV